MARDPLRLLLRVAPLRKSPAQSFVAAFAIHTTCRPAFRLTTPAHPLRKTTIPSRSFHQTPSQRLIKSTSQTQKPDPKYTYRFGAAYNGKDTFFNQKEHQFRFDSDTGKQWLGGQPLNAAAARDSRQASGQDAFFIGCVGETGATAFGVADGVGGWAEQGIDPADFAHGLCNYMADSASSYPNEFKGQKTLNPRDLLQVGYTRVCSDESIEGGGSTACVAVAQPQGELKVANLGDSGFVQLRLNAVHYVSEVQQHAFNTPYQLSHIPAAVREQIDLFGGGAPLGDMPKHAQVTEHELRHGDVMVFGTDGLWDNLSPQDVLAVVSKRMLDEQVWTNADREGTVVAKALYTATEGRADAAEAPLQTVLAVSIVNAAKQASMDLHRDGPFAKSVQRAFPRERWHGGKVDDICVVVMLVLEEAAAVDARL